LLTNEDRRRYEQKIASLEEDLDEEQSQNEILLTKHRMAQQQVESLTTDLSLERAAAAKVRARVCKLLLHSVFVQADADRNAADRQVKELRARLQEMEASATMRSKAQLAALEQKCHNLEEQLTQETK
jgi:hypothetical protein